MAAKDTKAAVVPEARKTNMPEARDTNEPEKLDLRSLDIAAERRGELLRLFPEARTEGGKVNFDRLKSALGDIVDTGRERYGLTWPGKADCFRTIQAPSLGTLRPAPDESVNFETTENVIIEGDNLEVLKLLQKSYLGKIKMIYIDPPYNTGNDFIYPDNFGETLQTYLQYTGQVDAEGRRFGTNTEADGRFHSKWLNMMYPRLYLARNLLQEDGAIFISIDENEVNRCRFALDEVFGPENFIGLVCVASNPRGRQSEMIATTHEYVVAYARDVGQCAVPGQALSDKQLADYKHVTPDGQKYRLRGLRHRGNASRRVDRPKMFFPLYVDPKTKKVALEPSRAHTEEVLPRKSTGEDGRWEWGKTTAAQRIDRLEGVFVETRGEWDVHQREFLNCDEGDAKRVKWKSIWDEKEINYQNGKNELKSLFGECPVDYPKPLFLLRKIIEGTTANDDIILDFFAGSGTTAHAVIEANKHDEAIRKFLLVQLPEPTRTQSADGNWIESDAYKAGFATISAITKERVRRAASAITKAEADGLALSDTSEQDRGFRVFKLAESNLIGWDGGASKDAEALAKQLELHIDHIRQGRTDQDLLYELLLKSGFPLTTKVETKTLAKKTVYSVADGVMLICLDRTLTLDVIRAMADLKPERVVCLDAGFDKNDQLKANAVLTFKSKGVVKFMTV